jgi:hypothetical protein
MRSVLIPIAFLATIAAVPFAFAEQHQDKQSPKTSQVNQYPPPPIPTPTPTPMPTPTPTPTPTPIPTPYPTPPTPFPSAAIR